MKHPRMLRSAVHVRLVRGEGDEGRPATLMMLTNLTGHAFPTGTSRRAIDIQVTDAERNWITVHRLVSERLGARSDSDRAALDPGEQRPMTLAVSAGESQQRFRLIYIWNRFEEDSMHAVFWESSLLPEMSSSE